MCARPFFTGSLHDSAVSPGVDISTETWSVSQTGMHSSSESSEESYLASITDPKRTG